MTHLQSGQEPDPETIKLLQQHFEATVLPRIEQHAEMYFRQYRRDPEKMEELTQQAVANAWHSYRNICLAGRDPAGFLGSIAAYACRGVQHGRKIQGQEKSTSVSNPQLQRREGFRVEPLPASTATSHEQLYALPGGQKLHDELEERLRDNTVTPPPDQAAFRIDYPTWLNRLGSPRREIAEGMATGETTQALAEKHKKSESRISQMRRELQGDWQKFHGEGQER